MAEPDADPYEVARLILLRKLEQRARSRSELAAALAERGVPDDVATRVLDRFTEVGLIDDAAFAAAWSESRQRSKHLSRRAIEQELRHKGVDREVIAQAMEGHDADVELDTARRLAEVKCRTMRGLAPEVARRRLAGALARKGFAAHVVWQVVGEQLGGPRDDD